MAYVILSDWSTIPIPGVTDMNQYVRDNTNYLFNGRPTTQIKRQSGTDYNTTSTVFVSVDGTNVSVTMTINSGKADVIVLGSFRGDGTNGGTIEFDVTVDGTRQGSTNGIIHYPISAPGSAITSTSGVAFVLPLIGLSVGSHTFTLQWRSPNGINIFLGNGSTIVEPVYFHVREVG